MESSSLYFFKKENKDYYKNKNILITGATGGIGQVLVRTLYDLGANLLLISHNENKIKEKFNNLLKDEEESIKDNESNGSGRLHFNPLNKIQYEIIDLEDPKSINSKFPICMKKLRAKLDNIFICHGIYEKSPIKECSKEKFDKIMNINVRSVFHILSLSVPFLKISKGNCVIISSMESFIPVKDGFLNTTTKAMINSLVQNSALELSSFGVRINAVAPGLTNTDHRKEKNNDNNYNIGIMWNSLGNMDNNINNNDGEKFLLNKKILEPTNIVDTMLFLGSDEASFITGEIIQNDNGYGLNHDLSFTKET
jgi:NAD(P)-dependent dehydrogenase (short-subunit alcohol dehydrogenase family)